MNFDQRDTIGFHAAQLARLLANRLRDALAPLGVQPAQAAALIEIGRAEGLTQKELVERLDVPKDRSQLRVALDRDPVSLL